MPFVEHSLIKDKTIEEREYQRNILETALKKDTLIVLPTGTGKTPLAVWVAAHFLEKDADSKILMMSPTRPLCSQHHQFFNDTLDTCGEIALVTGMIDPQKRKNIYKNAQVVIATPQCIRNDIKKYVIDLSEFQMLIFDEAHRCVRNYAYTYVAKNFKMKRGSGRIIGLTASPGSTREKINQICRNLFIDAVEIRVETDEDIKPYIKGTDTRYVKVDLTPQLKEAQEKLKSCYNTRIEKLKKYNLHVHRRKDLLDFQREISKRIAGRGSPVNFYLISLIVEAIKISHFLQLLETQSVFATKKYIQKIREEKTKSDKNLLKDKDVSFAIEKVEESEEHPKIIKLREIISEEIKNDKEIKIILFSHFRDNIEKINEILQKVDGCSPGTLIGQSGEKGLSQKKQIEIVRDFEGGIYNCLVTSPIGEEGLHLASADLAIFYDSVPSEIRTIQRRGRVGRTKLGRIIFLLAKGTMDEAYYWTAMRKEKKMKSILKEMQNKGKGLNDFIEK